MLYLLSGRPRIYTVHTVQMYMRKCVGVHLIPTCLGVRGSAAHTGDGVDERNPGTPAVASLVPRHHRHEQVHHFQAGVR